MKREKQYNGVVPVVIDAFLPEIPASRALVVACSVCLRTDTPTVVCAYCGLRLCSFDACATDQSDVPRGVPLGSWACFDCWCQ